MNTAEALRQAAANQAALTEAARMDDEGEHEMRIRRDRERASAEAAQRARIEASKPKEFPVERVPWGLSGARTGRPRTLAKFVHDAAQLRDDRVGRLCRHMRADGFPLDDPTRILRNLALRNAPNEWRAAAREMIREFCAWEREGFEADLREVERVNLERARALRESLHESRKVVERLYAQDRDA